MAESSLQVISSPPFEVYLELTNFYRIDCGNMQRHLMVYCPSFQQNITMAETPAYVIPRWNNKHKLISLSPGPMEEEEADQGASRCSPTGEARSRLRKERKRYYG
jgi:hypothetical protein